MARRIPGEFVPCDVNLSSDPAIMRAGPMAELLFRRGNEYAKKNERDGVLYEMELPIVAFGITQPRKQADTLVRHRLWTKTDDGWIIRSFLKWNLSQEEQEAKKQANKLGAIKANHKLGRHEEPDAECPKCKEAA